MSNSYDEDMSGERNNGDSLISDDVKDVIGLIVIFIVLFYFLS